jgi:hypothetical protein
MARRRDPRPTDSFLDRIPAPGLPSNASVPQTLRLPSPGELRRGIVIAWKPANFGVYRAIIDRLQPAERFRMETQFGAFEMSAAEFATTFPNILASESYRTGSPRQHGHCVYVVGPPPATAMRFKVPH